MHCEHLNSEFRGKGKTQGLAKGVGVGAPRNPTDDNIGFIGEPSLSRRGGEEEADDCGKTDPDIL